MPDQSVDVTFDPNAEPQFTFVPATVTMTKAGKIVFHRRPQDAPWIFLDGRVPGDTSQFKGDPAGNGRLLHLHDKFTDTQKTSHKYMIKVRFEWGDHYREYESPDPVIVNDPGTRDVAISSGGRKKHEK